MPKRAIPIHLREEEQAELLHVTKRHKSGHQLVIRAQIVLAATEGKSNVAVAQELSVSVETFAPDGSPGADPRLSYLLQSDYGPSLQVDVSSLTADV